MSVRLKGHFLKKASPPSKGSIMRFKFALILISLISGAFGDSFIIRKIKIPESVMVTQKITVSSKTYLKLVMNDRGMQADFTGGVTQLYVRVTCLDSAAEVSLYTHYNHRKLYALKSSIADLNSPVVVIDSESEIGDQFLASEGVLHLSLDLPAFMKSEDSKNLNIEQSVEVQLEIVASSTFIVPNHYKGSTFFKTTGQPTLRVSYLQNKMSKNSTLMSRVQSMDTNLKMEASASFQGYTDKLSDSTVLNTPLITFQDSDLVLLANENNAEYCFKNSKCYVNLDLDLKGTDNLSVQFTSYNNPSNIYKEQSFFGEFNNTHGSLTPYRQVLIFEDQVIEDIDFTITPKHGDLEVYIKVGHDPSDDLKKADFSSTSKGLKRFSITKDILKDMKVTKEVIYIVLIPSNSLVRYSVSVTDIFEGKWHTMLPGIVEMGEIDASDVMAYRMGAYTAPGEVEFHDLVPRLHIISGEADLFFKVCSEEDSCMITQQEINTTLAQGQFSTENSNVGIINTDNKHAIKQLELKLACGSPPDMSVVPKEYTFQKNCDCALFVIGRNSKNSTKVVYEFSVEDLMDSHVLTENHFLRVHLLQDQVKTYHYEFVNDSLINNSNPLNSTPLKAVYLSVEVRYGKVDLCISKSSSLPKGPFSKETCTKIIHVDGNQHGSASNLFKKKLGTESGKYYVRVKGVSSAAVNLAMLQKYDDLDEEYGEGNSYVARSLKAGVAISDRMEYMMATKLYSFKLQMDESVQVITIKILPKRGHFKILVRNDDLLPQLDQGYWISDDNQITITNEDPKFNPKAEYIVMVIPIREPHMKLSQTLGGVSSMSINDNILSRQGEMEQDVSDDEDLYIGADEDKIDFEYDIKFTYTGKHDIMTPGVPEIGILHDFQKCYTIEILPDYKNLMLVKNKGNMDFTIFASIGSGNSEPNGKNSQYSINNDRKTLYIEDVASKCQKGKISHNNQCHLYFCIYGGKPMPYSVVFNYNIDQNYPFLMVESSALSLPVPKRYGEFHYLFHPSSNHPLDLEVKNFDDQAYVLLKCIPGDKKLSWRFSNQSQKLAAQKNLRTGLANIYLTRDQMKKYGKSPQCMLKLMFKDKPYHGGGMINTPFMMYQSASVMYSQSVKQLQNGHSVLGRIHDGIIQYYTFYMSSEEFDFIVSAHSLSELPIRIFVDKGRNKRPTFKSHLNIPQPSSNVILTTEEVVKAGGYPSMEGYYVVGVESISGIELEFTIIFRNLEDSIIQPEINLPISIMFNSNEPIDMMMPFIMSKDGNKQSKHLLVDVDSRGGSGFEIDFNLVTQKQQNLAKSFYNLFPSSNNQSQSSLVIAEDQEFSRFDISKNSLKDKKTSSSFYTMFGSVLHMEPISLEVMFHLSGTPIRLFFNKEMQGSYYANSSEPIEYELKSVEQGCDRYLLVEAPHVMTFVVEGHTLKPFETDVGIYEVNLPKPPKADYGRWTSENIEIRVKDVDEDFGFKITAITTDLSLPLKINIPKKRIFATKKNRSFNSHMYSFELNYINQGEILMADITPKNFVYMFVPGQLTEEERRVIKYSVKFKYGKTSSDLENKPLNLKYKSFQYSPNGMFFGLHNKIGFYSMTIDWDMLQELIINKGGNHVYSASFSNKIAFGASYPFYKVIGFPGNGNDISIMVKDGQGEDGVVEFDFLKCFGNFQIDIDSYETQDQTVPTRLGSINAFENQSSVYSLDSETSISRAQISIKKSKLDETLEDSKNSPRNGWTALAITVNRRYYDDRSHYIEKGKIKKVIIRGSEITAIISLSKVFFPLSQENEFDYIARIQYGGVVSKNPKLTDYQTSCPDYKVSNFFQEGTQEEYARSKIRNFVNQDFEISKDGKTAKIVTKVEKDSVYYMGIYALVRVYRQQKGTTHPEYLGYHRVVYDKLEFETTAFWVEWDIMSMFVFLIGIVIFTFYILGSSMRGVVKRAVGFQSISEGPAEGVDGELESYFMKMREVFGDDFVDRLEEEEEEERAERREIESGSNDTSATELDESNLPETQTTEEDTSNNDGLDDDEVDEEIQQLR